MKFLQAHLEQAAIELNELIQPEDKPFKTTPKTTKKEVQLWIREAVTVLEPEDEEVLKTSTIEVLKEMGLTDWMAIKPAEVKAEKPIKKSAEKAAPKKAKKKGGKAFIKKAPTKNTVTPSSEIIHRAWSAGETDVDKLLQLCNHKVKRASVIWWIARWKKGINLPAYTRK